MSLAFLFPGQGAQAVGMGRALAEAHPVARETFAEADAALGFALSAVCWQGPEDELRKTHNAQPALLTHGVAACRLLQAQGFEPSWAAGHSLGEYAACVAVGAMDFADAVRLVRRRGELMWQAGVDRPGTMAAILGLDADTVRTACGEASDAGVVVPANLNAPGQVVISGEIAAVEKACERAKAHGAKRAIRLEVSGAFHSPLMSAAARGLDEALAAIEIRDGRAPVIANVSAEPVQRAADIRAALSAQLMGAVRWEDSMRFLTGQPVTAFVECGTGRVLRGLLRTLDREAVSYNVEDPDSFEATRQALAAGQPAGEGVMEESLSPATVEAVRGELAGQVAFVTGGAAGIGLAVAGALAARGAQVAIFNRNRERADAAIAQLTAAGGVAHAFTMDVASSESVDAAFGQAIERLGRVDALVNNAGLTRDGVFLRMSDAQWDEVLDTNLKGAFRCCRAVARTMMKARSGRIVNVSSVVGRIGNAGQANYAASKAGLLGLTRSLARELASRGITVNAVCPGFIETDMTAALPEAAREDLLRRIPLGRLGAAAEVADVIAFLVSPRASYVTGQTWTVDGGMVME